KQGNTIKEETSTGNNIFEYNTLNQQVKAITKDGNTLVSRYDTEGLRAEIEENEKLTKFTFHKENILVETDKDWNVVSRFARGYEVVAADIANLGENLNSEVEYRLNRHYYIVDEQGSTVLITDGNQSIKNEYWYDAFGNVLHSKEQVHNRITYTGQQYDSITQQYYLRARYYNPIVGRFTQEDIYRGDGLNLYAYCGNNPVSYYDPSGYERTCDSKSTSFEGTSKKEMYNSEAHNVVNYMKYKQELAKEGIKEQYKIFVKNKNNSVAKTSGELLPNELDYGPYKSLKQKKNDNITPHHMPANDYMSENFGVPFRNSYAMNLEHIFPGQGGRHKRTFTYGLSESNRPIDYKLYNSLSPRDALAFDINDARRILKEDGIYDSNAKKKLMQYIKDAKQQKNGNGKFIFVKN
ncbi:RHS repeat-associated core domain-containing protein, partial [Clostridium saccharoperbutylacetonicum]|uniref:RHS repeat-associated core domain-containing protein n=1 Tax=Clostridium saccharoperbutylacetonicum TaxID=36745 RepID=UPI0039EA864D